MRFVRVILICLVLAPIARAQPEVHCDIALRVLEENYSKIYKPFECCVNTNRLVNAMTDEGVPVEHINVIYLLYEKYRNPVAPMVTERDLRPAVARSMSPYIKTWPGHVLAELHGNILDLDFMKQMPPAAQYFSRMFPSSNHHPEGNLEDYLWMRVIPAAVNRDLFNQHSNDGLKVFSVFGDRKDSLPQYPRLTVREYLDRSP